MLSQWENLLVSHSIRFRSICESSNLFSKWGAKLMVDGCYLVSLSLSSLFTLCWRLSLSFRIFSSSYRRCRSFIRRYFLWSTRLVLSRDSSCLRNYLEKRWSRHWGYTQDSFRNSFILLLVLLIRFNHRCHQISRSRKPLIIFTESLEGNAFL